MGKEDIYWEKMDIISVEDVLGLPNDKEVKIKGVTGTKVAYYKQKSYRKILKIYWEFT